MKLKGPSGFIERLPPSFRAGVWMSGTVISFTCMAVAGREASFELDTFELMTYRSFAGFVIVLSLAGLTGRLNRIAFSNLRLHATRNVLHFAATNLWFYAVATIPLAQVFAFEFSTPIWAAILAPLFLNERITVSRIVTLAVGFLGIMIVARPGIIEFSPGLHAAMLCAVGFAGSAVATRMLVRHADVISVLFWMTSMQFAFAIVLAGHDGDFVLPSRATALPLIVVSVAGVAAHYCLTSALRLAPAVVVMPFDFVRLPLIMLVGLLLYSEAVDTFTVVGGLIILTANYLNIRNEARTHSRT